MNALGQTLGIITGVLFIGGFLVRYALVPYLEKRWSQPVEEIRNGFRDIHAELIIFSRAFDGHLTWSQQEVDRIWEEFQRRRRTERDDK